MNPETRPVTSLANPNPTEVFKLEIVESIISKRKKGALHGMVVIGIVLIMASLLDTSTSTRVIIIATALLLPPLLAIYALNAKNSRHLQPSYRKWNTWIYNYGSKFLIITAILRIFSHTKDLVNPLHGFKDPGTLPKSTLMLEVVAEAGVGAVAYSNLKPAVYVEEYFKQLEACKETRSHQYTQRIADANHRETMLVPEDSDQLEQP